MYTIMEILFKTKLNAVVIEIIAGTIVCFQTHHLR